MKRPLPPSTRGRGILYPIKLSARTPLHKTTLVVRLPDKLATKELNAGQAFVGTVQRENEVTEAAISQIFNIACGERTSLNQLAQILKDNLSKFDPEIANLIFEHGATLAGDVPHSLASIKKGETMLGYKPKYSVKKGLEEACDWYWENIK